MITFIAGGWYMYVTQLDSITSALHLLVTITLTKDLCFLAPVFYFAPYLYIEILLKVKGIIHVSVSGLFHLK